MLSCFNLAKHDNVPVYLAKQGPRGWALDDFVRWEVIQMVGVHSRIYRIATSSAGEAVKRGGGGGGGVNTGF